MCPSGFKPCGSLRFNEGSSVKELLADPTKLENYVFCVSGESMCPVTAIALNDKSKDGFEFELLTSINPLKYPVADFKISQA